MSEEGQSPKGGDEILDELRRERDKLIFQKYGKKIVADLSVGERLRLRDRAHTIVVSVPDPEGDIPVRVRPPSLHIISEAMKINDQMRHGLKDVEDLVAYEDRVCHLLGDEICVDPELGYDFWKDGDYAPSLPLLLLNLVVGWYDREAKQGANFRRDKAGTSVGGVVHEDGPAPVRGAPQ